MRHNFRLLGFGYRFLDGLFMHFLRDDLVPNLQRHPKFMVTVGVKVSYGLPMQANGMQARIVLLDREPAILMDRREVALGALTWHTIC
jgi:hypothetical protein